MKLEMRAAQERDVDFARLAHHAAYRDVVERQFGPWDENAQDDFFVADWDTRTAEIILADGSPCGYCIVERRSEDIHARELVIHPDFQGQGIGSLFLRGLQDEARRRSVPVRLGTFHENRAVELYARLGFREIGSTETHVLMEWTPTTTNT